MLWVSFLKQAVAADDISMVKKLLQKEVRPSNLPDKFLTEIFYDPSVKEAKPYMLNAFGEFLPTFKYWVNDGDSPCVVFLERISDPRTRTIVYAYLHAHTYPLPSFNMITCASFFEPDFLRRLNVRFDMSVASAVLKKLEETSFLPMGTTNSVLNALYENMDENDRSAFLEVARKSPWALAKEWVAKNQQVDVVDECLSELKELDKKRVIVLEKLQGELKKQKK